MQHEQQQVRQALPVVQIISTSFFVDLEQRLFTDAFNPQHYVDFRSLEGQRLCEQASIISCSGCGMSVIVPMSRSEDRLRCMSCEARVGGPFATHEEKVRHGR